jgi:hypothetical protein
MMLVIVRGGKEVRVGREVRTSTRRSRRWWNWIDIPRVIACYARLLCIGCV